MTAEYIILGVILIVLGGVQTWLRHGPAAEDPERKCSGDEGDRDRYDGVPSRLTRAGAGRVRSGRAWDAWTAVLGGICVVVGIALVVIGALGR